MSNPAQPFAFEEADHQEYGFFDTTSAHVTGVPGISKRDVSFLQQADHLAAVSALWAQLCPGMDGSLTSPLSATEALLESSEPSSSSVNDAFYLESIPLSFWQTPYEGPLESPFSDYQPTPIMDTPIFAPYDDETPYNTPDEEFNQDPQLSPAPFSKNTKKVDEGYGSTEFNRVYSPEEFDGNPCTLINLPEKPLIDYDANYDPEESSGNLIEPLVTNFVEEESHRRRRRSSTDSNDQPRRFRCNHKDCNRAFKRLFNLHTHEKTHDPHREKPYKCKDKDCGKSFARKHDLSRHEASVHRGERHFTCKRCDKPFSRKDALRRHTTIKGCPGYTQDFVQDMDMSSESSTES